MHAPMSEKKYETPAERLRAWREKHRNTVSSTVSPVTVSGRTVSTVSRPGTFPHGYDPKLWAYACERALRARRYAQKMPEHVRPSEIRFQSPEWQYMDQSRYPLPC